VYYGWEDISVTYEFPAPGPQPPAYTALSITDLGIADDIHAAFSRWTYANQAENPSNVGFYFGTPGQVRVYALRVNFPGDPANGDHGRAAWTTVGVWEGTDSVAVSDIHLYYDSMSGGIPVTDPSAPNFHTFIQKAVAHEIGHSMGLDDQPIRTGNCGGQVAGQSVMNVQCGTNDSANNLPAPALGLPSCDNQSVHY
jgi:hypothetical protein